jgi:hypothetical protein
MLAHNDEGIMNTLSSHLTCTTLIALLTACAAGPDNEVREQLDQRTGVTVTRMKEALQFYSPLPELGLQATRFAYLGPLEVNRMGERNTYLWLSVLPASASEAREGAEVGPPARLRLIVDKESFDLEVVASSAEQIDLGKRAYPRPADWAREGYWSASPEVLARLATAASLLLEIDSGDGQLRRYEPWKADLETLRQFVAQISPDAP